MSSVLSSRRQAGVLLHITSLPGAWGVGDLGSDAFRFVDWLASAGQSIWQILPLGPPACGASPYQAYSAFAGNPLLISPEQLVADGLLEWTDIDNCPASPVDCVDFESIGPWRAKLLRLAWRRFNERSEPERRELWDFGAEHAWWLDDYALFMALRDNHTADDWTGWPIEWRARHHDALQNAKRDFADDFGFHQFGQLQFFKQWQTLRRYANERGVQILGDVPIFVGHNSSDVWARQDLFQLDESGTPTVVAGVPPDYFCETGQRWGNPLYRWDRLAEQGFGWWVDRIRSTLQFVDLLRIDHFRGFQAYWEIPAESETAQIGRWVPGPGESLFHTLKDRLGTLPIIAEDLGLITQEVEALRDGLGLPGMRVAQFAFGDESGTSCHWPHTYVKNCVAYTGTHDNDTTRGWYEAVPGPKDSDELWEAERLRAREYLDRDGSQIAWDMARAVFASVADRCVVPIQDLLELGTEARMNIPGTPEGNWRWRLDRSLVTPELTERLRKMTEIYARGKTDAPQPQPE
ncbi:MAG: 4-alpha-glucanotransferase [Planctomycetota bacterium]|nr:4-alpha-glucanotransferase [Planctomycetota bacterium]